MKYGSVCSGIEAASVAWHPLGWKPAFFCEIDPFPSTVLAHHYPEVKNYGDFTKLIDAAHPVHSEPPIDLLVGGTPCQAFSVAGLRQGLADPRGGLTLEFLRLARVLRPRWVVWENVPGVLSQDGGRAFGAFLGGLEDLGYGWAYRVLDAQYTRVDGYAGAVPQRRKRVFVVGRAGGDFSRAAAVLLEPEGVRRDSPPRRAARKDTAADAAGGFEVCGTLSDGAHHGGGLNGQDAYTGRIQPVAFSFDYGQSENPKATHQFCVEHTAPLIKERVHAVGKQPFAFDARQADTLVYGDKTGPLDTDGQVAFVKATNPHSKDEAPRWEQAHVSACINGWDERHDPPKHVVALASQVAAAVHAASMAVRRLTPVECERLQGFPDDYTRIPWKRKPAEECPDGGRYKALGNSMACNVMRWIGRRIELVDSA